jgi:hypothetical protein
LGGVPAAERQGVGRTEGNMTMTLILFALLSAATEGQNAAVADEPEAAVWRATLNFAAATPVLSVPGRPAESRIVLHDATGVEFLRWRGSEDVVARFAKQNVTLSRELADRFEEANQSDVSLKSIIKNTKELTLISKSKVRSLFREPPRKGPYDIWQRFHDEYPDARGLYQLSRVGILDDHALVFLSRSCGMKCARAGFILLRRTEDGWSVEKEIVTGMS